MLITSTPLRAADTDSRIESSAAKSYVFKTYLKDDSIKTDSKDGVVTLTGTVADASAQIPGRRHRGEPARRQERGQSTRRSAANNRRNIPTPGSA